MTKHTCMYSVSALFNVCFPLLWWFETHHIADTRLGAPPLPPPPLKKKQKKNKFYICPCFLMWWQAWTSRSVWLLTQGPSETLVHLRCVHLTSDVSKHINMHIKVYTLHRKWTIYIDQRSSPTKKFWSDNKNKIHTFYSSAPKKFKSIGTIKSVKCQVLYS